MLKTMDERSADIAGRLSYIANEDKGFMWDDNYATERLDHMAQVCFVCRRRWR